MSISLGNLGRAETAALIVETLAAQGIEVVLVGGSCACVWTNERFGSFDLDFIDLTYKRRKQIAAALADIGRNHKIIWPDLKEWHRGEGYADRYKEFKEALN